MCVCWRVVAGVSGVCVCEGVCDKCECMELWVWNNDMVYARLHM